MMMETRIGAIGVGGVSITNSNKLIVPVCQRCLWYFPHCEDKDFDCLCGRDIRPMLVNKDKLDKLVEKGILETGQMELELPESVLKVLDIKPCPDFEVAHFMLVQGFSYTPKQVFLLREVERAAKRLMGEECDD